MTSNSAAVYANPAAVISLRSRPTIHHDGPIATVASSNAAAATPHRNDTSRPHTTNANSAPTQSQPASRYASPMLESPNIRWTRPMIQRYSG